jgi:hypothetical protein
MMPIQPLAVWYCPLLDDPDWLKVERIARFLLLASGGIINR